MLLITELQLQIHYTHCVKVFIQSINDEAFKVQDSYQVKLSSEVKSLDHIPASVMLQSSSLPQ